MRWKIYLMSFILVLLLLAASYGVFLYYGTIFSKNVDGRVIDLKEVVGENMSYVIAVRDKHGNIFTGPAMGPRWSLVKPGQCAEIRFLPYPPWQVERIGTYASTLLLKMRDCKSSDGPWPFTLKTQGIDEKNTEESANY